MSPAKPRFLSIFFPLISLPNTSFAGATMVGAAGHEEPPVLR